MRRLRRLSRDGGRLTHRLEFVWQTLISPSLCLPFVLPPVDLCIRRPRSTPEERNEDPWNEMPKAALPATHRENVADKEQETNRAEPLGVMRIVWLYFTADGSINLPATQCGHAFPPNSAYVPNYTPGALYPLKMERSVLRKGAEENITCVKNRLPLGCRAGGITSLIHSGGGQGDEEWQVLSSGLCVDLPCMRRCGKLSEIVTLTKNYLWGWAEKKSRHTTLYFYLCKDFHRHSTFPQSLTLIA